MTAITDTVSEVALAAAFFSTFIWVRVKLREMMTAPKLRHGLECPACGDTAFFVNDDGFICDQSGKLSIDGDPACCGCKLVYLSADEDGADVGGAW